MLDACVLTCVRLPQMLSVNEDMIMAVAECHADNDVEGTLA